MDVCMRWKCSYYHANIQQTSMYYQFSKNLPFHKHLLCIIILAIIVFFFHLILRKVQALYCCLWFKPWITLWVGFFFLFVCVSQEVRSHREQTGTNITALKLKKKSNKLVDVSVQVQKAQCDRISAAVVNWTSIESVFSCTRFVLIITRFRLQLWCQVTGMRF